MLMHWVLHDRLFAGHILHLRAERSAILRRLVE